MRKKIRKFDLALVTSQVDKNILEKKIEKQNIYVLKNGMTIENIPKPLGGGNKNQILFVGKYDYGPNLEGFFFFYENIFPLIKKRYPHIKLCAVGGNPTETMLEISRTDKSVIVTGLVEETIFYYNSSSVAVVPLKSGSGTRFKILESFAFKVPVVSTSIGCEGIDVVDRKHLLVADEPKMFADAVVELIENQSLVQKICENAFQLVSSQYSWERIINNFKKEIDVLLQS